MLGVGAGKKVGVGVDNGDEVSATTKNGVSYGDGIVIVTEVVDLE